jgi:hypothetical protein
MLQADTDVSEKYAACDLKDNNRNDLHHKNLKIQTEGV